MQTPERQVTDRIPLDIAEKTGKIYVEYRFSSNPLKQTHSLTQYGPIARFVNKRSRASLRSPPI